MLLKNADNKKYISISSSHQLIPPTLGYGLQNANGDRADVRNLAILITDGVANEREDETLTQAALLRDVAYIMTIGITNAIDEPQLKLISSGNEVIMVGDFSELGQVIIDLEEASCNIPPIGRLADYYSI